MILIQVCVGSSCFVKGAHDVIKEIQTYIKTNSLNADIQLEGSFCKENCNQGVSVTIDGELFTGIKKENIPGLLNDKILYKGKEE